ncbi:uncharacterized protein FOMMEDRAFT_141050 [Fomitiporia mediterranea MF3/22]|uniref:uncharacterized protein n=1 Tax=Fomitiporia mediterranea (strain MF3/22) TaxID=694068 RepID=UPI0004409304|nr:uncharacterized protein FOMMEDRAFT_141050 [Fomitiporia mediterranea MF3/22]EJD01782.1 hypothetical protein FOMMEDRAFT_141050 [Fomitiporia mediterranea MF3/22]
MATALELATDRKHVELDESEKNSHTHSISSVSQGGQTPTLAEYMRQAEISRAREAGQSQSAPLESDNRTTPEKPDIEDELITARRALRNASWAAIFYLITTDILGPFNAPFAFSQVGYVPGAVLYVVMGGVACYTGLILWRLFCVLDSDVYPIKTYADIAERLIGRWFKHLCSALQSLQLIINVGTICLGNAQSVEQIANDHQFCFSVAILIWAIVGMVIGQIRSLKQYGWLANSAVWLNLLVIFITMGVVAHSPPNFKSAKAAFGIDQGPVQTSAIVSLPLFSKVNGIMQMVFAYGGAMIFPEFMAEMRRPMDFWKAMCCAQLLIATVYMLFGVFVYAFQGQFTLPLAFQGLSKFAWQTVGNVIALITGIIAAGLYGNIGIKVAYYHIVEQWFNGPPLISRKGRVVWTFMVILYWSLAFIVGSAIPQVQTISGLVAAVCIMQFTYTFPPLLLAAFEMQVDAARNDPGDTWKEKSRWMRAIFSSGPSVSTMTTTTNSGLLTKNGNGITNGTADTTATGAPIESKRTKWQLIWAKVRHNFNNLSTSKFFRHSRVFYKLFNLVLFLGSLTMACLGMYGSGKSIQATFASGGAATSFGCGAPV